MDTLFRLHGAARRAPAVVRWFEDHESELGLIAREWFDVIRARGDDVLEVLHDGCPTACIGDVAFAYVGVYRAHVSVGFFHGASLSDSRQLLEGSGKSMRHVKMKLGTTPNRAAISSLIEAAYWDIKSRIAK